MRDDDSMVRKLGEWVALVLFGATVLAAILSVGSYLLVKTDGDFTW